MTDESSMTIMARAAVLEARGKWVPAAGAYARGFARAVVERDVPAIADAVRGESRIRRLQGRLNAAEELATLCLEISDRNELRSSGAHALNILASIEFSRENLASAKRLFTESLERARNLCDDTLIGMTCTNLGALANTEGKFREARILYLESIAATVRSGDKRTAAMNYNNLGICCTALQEWLEAEVYLERGIEIAEHVSDMPLLARLLMNRAEPLILLGDLHRATNTLNRAEELAKRASDPEVLATVSRFRGAISRITGNFVAADEHLSCALAMAQEAELEMEHAEILEAQARLWWELGRKQEAISLLLQAHRGFVSLGARREIARTEQMLLLWKEGALVAPAGGL
ncbi:hypothetical protein BH23GEM3_BH23GEM3_08310 [soil metagenome]